MLRPRALPVRPGCACRRGPAGRPPDPDELAAMRASGVRLIVDLRTPGEGVAGEAVAAANAGIRYVNLPVGHEPASANVQARLESLLEETDGDVLLHCASGNRAGEVWARHLLAQGASLEKALQAGRAGGLQEEREAHVRAAAGEQESGRRNDLSARAGKVPGRRQSAE
ncbi:MAG: sulfur transferase domain-containing protein [Gammaproteobacteria bacterium]|nr:sulfur transferase domain-containing protein [Gammaproteobacteria bacterium]